MCYNVHMRRISIRELHLETGSWVRRAAALGAVVITDRGRPVAELRAHKHEGRPLPDREASVQARGPMPDSSVYLEDIRRDR